VIYFFARQRDLLLLLGEDALFLWKLEEMDPSPGRVVVHITAVGRAANMHLATADVSG